MSMTGALSRKYFPWARYFVGGQGRQMIGVGAAPRNVPAPQVVPVQVSESCQVMREPPVQDVGVEQHDEVEVVEQTPWVDQQEWDESAEQVCEVDQQVPIESVEQHHWVDQHDLDGVDDQVQEFPQHIQELTGLIGEYLGDESNSPPCQPVSMDRPEVGEAVPGSDLSLGRIGVLDPVQAIEALKYMYEKINEEKTNRNRVLRDEVDHHQELLNRSNNVARELHSYNIDIDGLVTVRLWSIQPPAPRVEELPAEGIESKVPEDQESVNVSIDGGYPTVGSTGLDQHTVESPTASGPGRVDVCLPVKLRDRSSSNESRVKTARRTKNHGPSTSRGRSPQVGRTYEQMFPSPSRVARERGEPSGSSSARPDEKDPKAVYPMGRVDAPRKSA
jgi:hypothetical protein